MGNDPFWFAARGEARNPVRRAANYDRIIPIEVDARQLADMLDLVVHERGSLDDARAVRRRCRRPDLRLRERLGLAADRLRRRDAGRLRGLRAQPRRPPRRPRAARSRTRARRLRVEGHVA